MDQQPTAEELAAALAAIGMFLEQEQQPDQPEQRAGWSASARLMVQRMPPRRVRTLTPSWRSAERLRRDQQGGFTGVTGI